MRVRDVAAGGRHGDGGCSSAAGRSSRRAGRHRGRRGYVRVQVPRVADTGRLLVPQQTAAHGQRFATSPSTLIGPHLLLLYVLSRDGVSTNQRSSS